MRSQIGRHVCKIKRKLRMKTVETMSTFERLDE